MKTIRSLVLAAVALGSAQPYTFAQTPPPTADVGVSKSGPTEAAAGTDVIYTVSVLNAGPDDADTTVVRDDLPPGMTFVSATQTTGPAFSCTTPLPGDTTGSVTCTLNPMPAGSTADFTITYHIPAATPPGTSFTNVVSVSTTTLDPNSENDQVGIGTFVPFASQSDAGVIKNGPEAAGPDTDVAYSITIINGGPSDATDLVFTDTLPGTMTFVSLVQNSGPPIVADCVVPAAGSGGTITCTPPSFPAGGTATLTLTGHIPPGTPSGTGFMNDASVTVTGDPNSENDAATSFLLVSNVDVSVTKSGPAAATAGTDITYVLNAANAGPDTATNVVLNDALPAGTRFVSLTQTGAPASCSTPPSGANGTVTCSFIALVSGDSAQVTLVVNTGSGASTITNTATITTDRFDRDSSNNTSSFSTVVTQTADVTLTKSGPAAIPIETDAAYTIVVTNNGPSDAASVVVTDAIPAQTTFVSATQTAGAPFTCTQTAGVITCNGASLPAGTSATFRFVVHLRFGATGTISNTATVTSPTDSTPANNSSTATAAVAPSIPALSPLALMLLAFGLTMIALRAFRG